MKWLPGLVIGIAGVPAVALAAGALGQNRHGSVPSRTPTWAASTPPRVTVLDATPTGSREILVLRGRRGDLRQVVVPATARVTTRDNRQLRPTNILAGDTLVLRAGGRIQDISQAQAVLDGVVAHTPSVQGDPMILLVHRSQGVLVDMTAATGSSIPSPSLADIEEADLVRVSGVLDQTVGEMTQTDTVVRRGP